MPGGLAQDRYRDVRRRHDIARCIVITYSKVPRLAAVVAAAAGGATAETQGRAIRLHMAKALAVVALLRLGGPGKRAAVGLVAGLLAWRWY